MTGLIDYHKILAKTGHVTVFTEFSEWLFSFYHSSSLSVLLPASPLFLFLNAG